MIAVIKNARIGVADDTRKFSFTRAGRPAARKAPLDSIKLQSEMATQAPDYTQTGVLRAAARHEEGRAATDASDAGDPSPPYQCGYRDGVEAGQRAGRSEGRELGQQEGYDSGYESGHEAGHRLGHEEGAALGMQHGCEQARSEIDASHQADAARELAAAEASAAALQSLLAGLQEADAALQARAEVLAVDIAWTALMRLLGEAAGKREAVAGMVRAVLAQARSQQVLRVCLAPADLTVLQQEMPADFTSFALVPDARVPRGGCLVETVAGALDGRLETQLDALRELLVANEGASP